MIVYMQNGGEFIIKTSIKSNPAEVKKFLNELFGIIDDRSFNIDKNFVLIRSNKEDKDHSTPYTIADLEFDSEDVVNTIRQLTIADYSQTLLDKDDLKPPLLFVFGKDINQKPIYIKLKIKEKKNKYILCVSFHYAKYPMNYPYAQVKE